MELDALSFTRFLIVDDELPNILVLQGMLEHWGCAAIASTTDPREALTLYQTFQPDIILLDLMMPHLDGFAVMAQIRAATSPDEYLPILVLTADMATETRHQALAAGAKDFLSKPFDSIELSLRIRLLAETRMLHMRMREQNRSLEERVQERTLMLTQAEVEAVECLALAAEFRDDDTGQHCQRVSQLTALLATGLGIDPGQVSLLRRAAPLHDVGKIGIPDHILLKPGKLTSDEFTLMKQHTTIGAQILSRHHTPTMQVAATIALAHHERWDGSGYPHGLVGVQIPLAGRLVGIVDVFDALTHERPYKQAWTVGAALAEIGRGVGRQFDPDVAAAFIALIEAQVGPQSLDRLVHTSFGVAAPWTAPDATTDPLSLRVVCG